MAISANLLKIQGIMALNNGSTSTGAVKTKNLKIGGSSQDLDPTVYTTNISDSRQKLINIVDAIEPILTKTVYMVQEVQTNALVDDE